MKTGAKVGIASVTICGLAALAYKFISKRLENIYNDIMPIYDDKLDRLTQSEQEAKKDLESKVISGSEYNSRMRTIRNDFSNVMNEYDREVTDRFFGRI